MRSFIILLSLVFTLILFSCNNTPEVVVEPDITDTTAIVEVNKTYEFIVLPSPIETSLVLKKAGVQFDESVLNSTSKKSDYSTNISMSLNLGVYSADLCFSSMFNQSQTSIKYLSATKDLGEELDIMDAIDKTTFERMEANASENDSLMHILSEVIMNADMFLKENDRAETAAIMLVGGWIEGLYITLQAAESVEANEALSTLIVDQRLSLDNLLQLLDKYKENKKYETIIASLDEIKSIYNKIEIVTSEVKLNTDTVKKITVISSSTEAKLTSEVFNELKTNVKSFRDNITNGEIL